MATQQGIRDILEAMVPNFKVPTGQREQWALDQSKAWMFHPAVQQAGDDKIRDLLVQYAGKSDFAPKLKDIVAMLAQSPSRGANASAGPDCPDCGGTGWAEGSALLKNGGIDGPWALVCGCRPFKGDTWQDYRNRMEKRRDVERFWITDRDLRQIPDEGRLTAAQLAARGERKKQAKVLAFQRKPVDEHAETRRRQEKELKKEGWL